ncbi:ATP-binding cassette domain-containing protein [Robbsia sp. Bb-Pol-6]|uniref:ATP-binding cassette domain-containing protein n=1 Tax=Robbsia betulipollinis TaxID=2981849 RepID=A0ABT3ZJF1_9BURK|nr:ATP-binding cassette domain-containing protein [Robbsia betulipollinis]MCY0386577.1 ATP-binding cassette domain-containing protein [Robbsia betulipollinis]
MASISLRAVQKAYGDHAPAVRDVNLEIGEHEFCVFLGPSGCGKSTLLRLIAGLEEVTDGEVRINGALVNDVPAAQRGVAMVFQSYALFPHMSVYENMAFGLMLAKTPREEIDRKVREAARALQLEPLLDRRPKALSGGQRQRVAIGRAIVRSPGVFLFDEPLSNLDATLRGQTRIEIARLHKQFEKASVVYVTHDQVEAMTLADKIVLLHAGAQTAQFGSIAQVGTPLALYHRPRSRFVAGFIGAPQMNFLAAQVAGIEGDDVVVRLDATGETLRTTPGAAPCGGAASFGLAIGQKITLGVRPEHLVPVSSATHETGAPSSRGAMDQMARTVTLVERLGEHCYLHLDAPDGTVLIAKAPGDWPSEAGARVAVRVPPAFCHLFTEDGFAVASAPVLHPA